MIFSCNLLYRSLQKDLSFPPAGPACRIVDAEHYFKICFHYWMEVYALMDGYTFCSRPEEIHFFRNIKPLFTSGLEYAQLLCNALLFLPGEEEQRAYWQREAGRLGSFVREHIAFCRYYRSGASSCDAHYFTRVDPHSIAPATRHYPDEGLVSLYDPLVGRLLALRRYNRYVQGQLSALEGAADR